MLQSVYIVSLISHFTDHFLNWIYSNRWMHAKRVLILFKRKLFRVKLSGLHYFPIAQDRTIFVINIFPKPGNLSHDHIPVGYVAEGHGQRARLCCRLISDSIFWLVGVTPCPRKSQKNYTKEKTATGKRRGRFFYTFLYLLGSTTIQWMREFFLNTLKWLNPSVKVSKIR